jgi:hypothetical protein
MPITLPCRFASSQYGRSKPTHCITEAVMAINIIGHFTPLWYGIRSVTIRTASVAANSAAIPMVVKVAVQARHLLQRLVNAWGN